MNSDYDPWVGRSRGWVDPRSEGVRPEYAPYYDEAGHPHGGVGGGGIPPPPPPPPGEQQYHYHPPTYAQYPPQYQGRNAVSYHQPPQEPSRRLGQWTRESLRSTPSRRVVVTSQARRRLTRRRWRHCSRRAACRTAPRA